MHGVLSRLTFVIGTVGLVTFLLAGCTSGSEEGSVENTESSGLAKKAKKGRQGLDDGSIYEGELSKGKPNGYGIRKYANGDVYEGQHKNGYLHGYGSYLYKSSEEFDRYSGLWESGKREGFGTLVLTDSSRMEGHWNKDELLYGEYQGSNGVIFSGKWRQSSLSEGRKKSELNEEFTGSFNPDGTYDHGTFSAANGDRYTGKFQSDAYHGNGVLERVDGSVYVGNFARGDFSGIGVLAESKGTTYSGKFENGLPHGYGVQQDRTGVTYSGMWYEGEKNGAGTLDFGDGTSFSGEFKAGLAHQGSYDWGNGKITDSYQDENGQWLDR